MLICIHLWLSVAVLDIGLFFQATSRNERVAHDALRQIAGEWKDSYTPMFVEITRLYDDPVKRDRWIGFLEKQTGRRFGQDLHRWLQWSWTLPYDPHPDYARFKGEVYKTIDPRMKGFFPPDVRSLIRLDEIVWGGVKVDGIPPLDHPRVVAPAEAGYLRDGNIVFGLAVNGEARAYPKRILAWHELARDRLGGVELTVVYCTLCGTVIPYESVVGGRLRKLGTSGLLYRSNKLMWDAETLSLWSTLEGRPVVGPLAGSDLRLRYHPVVTTTWGEWRARHPNTTVLSRDTGHQRDYSEGAAYRNYFATDELMFQVPELDHRLKNKAEVLALRLEPERRPVAISVEFLARTPVYQDDSFVVVTGPDGANRVYASGGDRFTRRLPDGRIEDASARSWRVTEEALISGEERHPRLPAHRAFWFGWKAQFPETRLVK